MLDWKFGSGHFAYPDITGQRTGLSGTGQEYIEICNPGAAADGVDPVISFAGHQSFDQSHFFGPAVLPCFKAKKVYTGRNLAAEIVGTVPDDLLPAGAR